MKIGHPIKIGWVITVQDWAQIRYLHGSEGLSIRAIAAADQASATCVNGRGGSVVCVLSGVGNQPPLAAAHEAFHIAAK